MPIISILIPFRDTGDRKEQLDWLQKRWANLFPEAEIIIESDDGKDPFSKTIAVNKCYRRATSDILAIVDADVWLDPQLLKDAAEKIRSGKASWVRPCGKVYRLNKKFTQNLISFSASAEFPLVQEEDLERVTPTVGLVAVFSRKQFEYVGGMDERFRGWGWEDTAWNILLDGIFGKAEVWDNIVYHLWHPRMRNSEDKPIWPGQTNRNAKVGTEYKRNRSDKAKLNNLAEKNRKRNKIG